MFKLPIDKKLFRLVDAYFTMYCYLLLSVVSNSTEHFFKIDIRVECSTYLHNDRATMGSKTAKTWVLTAFFKHRTQRQQLQCAADVATTVAVLPAKNLPWWS